MLPLVAFDASAICQIRANNDLPAAAKVITDKINGLSNAGGVSFDAEGSCDPDSKPPTPLLSKYVQPFFEEVAKGLNADKRLVIFSGKPRNIPSPKDPSNWTLWPALNRTDSNCSAQSKNSCNMGFWIDSGYDQTPDGDIFMNNSVTEYSKMITKYSANKFNSEYATAANYIQVALPAAASAFDAASYQFFSPTEPGPLNFVNATWGNAQVGPVQHSCGASSGGSQSNCDQYNQISPDGGNVSQCQYLCVGLSALHAIFDSTARGNSSACQIDVDYGDAAIPSGFSYNRNQYIGVALYQINQPDMFYNACAHPSPGKKCPLHIPVPETVSDTTWKAFIAWLNRPSQTTTPLNICNTPSP